MGQRLTRYFKGVATSIENLVMYGPATCDCPHCSMHDDEIRDLSYDPKSMSNIGRIN
jgi:hypothetical protein